MFQREGGKEGRKERERERTKGLTLGFQKRTKCVSVKKTGAFWLDFVF